MIVLGIDEERAERRREICRRYRERHPERIAAAKARHREKHPDAMRMAGQKWAKNNPHKIRAKNAAKRKRRLDVMLMYNARKRSAAAAIPFAATIEDFLVPELCPSCSVPLRRGDRHSCPTSPTADRLIPSLGYVTGNIWVICHRCNTIKQDASSHELRSIADAIDAAQKRWGK